MTKAGGRFFQLYILHFFVYTGCINIRLTNSEIIEDIKTNILKISFPLQGYFIEKLQFIIYTGVKYCTAFSSRADDEDDVDGVCLLSRALISEANRFRICERNINFFDNGILFIHGKRDLKKK
jgi:hypothetical protein